MFFKQYYLGCLAHASYVIGDGGEAAVVDPRRDVDEYLADCEAVGLRIKYILETHLHADFVSGHIELAVAIDVRPAAAYGNAHVPGSLNLGLAGNFAPWAGALVAVDRPVVIIADDAEEARQAQMRLARVGMEGVQGYLDGGIAAWHVA